MSESPSELIDARIEELGDWRGELLRRLRGLVNDENAVALNEAKANKHG